MEKWKTHWKNANIALNLWIIFFTEDSVQISYIWELILVMRCFVAMNKIMDWMCLQNIAAIFRTPYAIAIGAKQQTPYQDRIMLRLRSNNASSSMQQIRGKLEHMGEMRLKRWIIDNDPHQNPTQIYSLFDLFCFFFLNSSKRQNNYYLV